MPNKSDHNLEEKSYDEDLEMPLSQLLRKNWKAVVAGIFFLTIVFGYFLWLPILFFLAGLHERFRLPYNAIDFQKIAYIDNQFVMYGIDYEHYATDKSLVIFNSQDGKKWDKSTIKITDKNQWQPISIAGTFNYFNGKCYLIGATVQPLVAPDCKHWQTQPINQVESNTRYLYVAHSSAVANNTLYVGGNHGVYKTIDGVTWSKEQLPYPEESNPRNFENSFYSMAVGNNKLITETNWRQNQKRRGLIYTKDLTTNQWSYEIYPVPIGNITRGKDRFVGLTESSAVVLEDRDNVWVKSTMVWNQRFSPSDISFGLANFFVTTNFVNLSNNGYKWERIKFTDDRLYGTTRISCSHIRCIAVSDNYQIISSKDGIYWYLEDFNLKHSKPHWWRRFINF